MNTQTLQSLDEIFEEGRISEMKKLNNWLKSLYINFTSEQLIVAKEDFLQKNANAFCNEFNQGSRYKDALWEFDRELFKNKAKFKFDTFSATFEHTKDDFLIRKDLIDNRLALFVEFFAVGNEKISFDLGRKQAWKDFGFGSNSSENNYSSNSFNYIERKATNEGQKDLGIYYRAGQRIKIRKMYDFLTEEKHIKTITAKTFLSHFNGGFPEEKIHWTSDLHLLIRMLDQLYPFLITTLYTSRKDKKSFLFEIAQRHFIVKDKELNSIDSWQVTRSNIDNNDSQIKKMDHFIKSLEKTKNITTNHNK